MLYLNCNWCATVCHSLDQITGAGFVDIEFPDDGTTGVPKHASRKQCVASV